MRRAWTAWVAALLGVACVCVVARSFPSAAQQRQGRRHHGTADAGATDATPADGGVADGAPTSDGSTDDAAAPVAEGESESARERESWRVAPDLVNPFSSDYDDDLRRYPDRPTGDGRARPVRPRSWYLVEEDLVDPWNRGDRRHVACEGGDCGGRSEAAASLDAPRDHARRPALTAQERLARSRGGEADLLVGAATLASGDARPRLDLGFLLRTGTFLFGLDIAVSGGPIGGIALAEDGHTFFRRSTYGRYAGLLSFGHRMTDGTLSVDLSLDFGAMISVLSTVDALPFARVAATGALRVARGVALLLRVDVGTSFAAPGGFVAGGPGAFELGLSLGVRLGGE